MSLYERLLAETGAARRRFMAIPVLQRALHGSVSRNEYLAFLGQAYHHVRHTVPLLMACGQHLPQRLDWLRDAMGEYIAEETGHERWILDDIRATGGDADAARDATPSPATEVMVAYAYDMVTRRNPVGFLGMVFVLESTSAQLATLAAEVLQGCLRLPDEALRYLTSHGTLDQDHIAFYRTLVDRLEEPGDQDTLIHSANIFYGLYGAIFDSLPSSVPTAAEVATCAQ
ncbi:MAG: iron-containing redox enzyme family protein [Gammaproteobacteria bacterium]